MTAVYSSPASIAAGQLRLLALAREGRSNKPTFRLDTFDKADRSVAYKAISYAWEDDTPVTAIELEDGQSLPLSRTLAELFNALVSGYEHVRVWIDAICINQSDAVEKADQVQRMHEVYANAEQVFIWLGPADRDVRFAFRYMLSIGHWSWPHDWERDKDHGELYRVFSVLTRPWFRRLWVIQEVALGTDVVVMCGDLPPVNLQHFAHCTYALWRYCEHISAADWDDLGQKGLRCFSRLLAIRQNYLHAGYVSYELLLQAARFCSSKDLRDKIFGLQGIAVPCASVPSPDYSVSLDMVRDSGALAALHTHTSLSLLCEGGNLDSLSLAGLDRRPVEPELPSWVMNIEHVDDDEPLTMANSGRWNAGGASAHRVAESTAGQLLLTASRGVHVAEICRAFDFDDIQDLRRCMREILSLWPRGTRQSSDSNRQRINLWKTKVMRSMMFGLDIDDDPITPADHASFHQWLDTILSTNAADSPQALHDNSFYRTAYLRVDSWRAGLTNEGSLLIAPGMVKEGDQICIVPGCRFPLALRRRDELGASCNKLIDGQKRLSYSLIGWCFVDGWMQGEHRRAGCKWREIVLH